MYILCGTSDSNVAPSQEPLDKLRKICSIKGLLSKLCTLQDPFLGCVYEETFSDSKVRIRRVKAYPGGDTQKVKEECIRLHVHSAPRCSLNQQILRQVAMVWRHTTHPNIVPLLCATIDPPQLISDQMPGGDLTEYIVSRLDADRTNLASDVSALLYNILTLSLVVWCRRRSQTSAFAQHDSRRPQRSARLFLASFNRLIDIQTVEYPCGRQR